MQKKDANEAGLQLSSSAFDALHNEYFRIRAYRLQPRVLVDLAIDGNGRLSQDVPPCLKKRASRALINSR